MRKKEEFKNARTVIVFVVLVMVAVTGSLLYKGFLIVKNSTFDPSHRYTIFIEQTNPVILSLDPNSQSASVIQIQNKNVDSIMKVPIDGYVKKKNSSEELFSFDDAEHAGTIDKFFIQLFSKLPRISSNMTIIDIGRLSLVASSIPSHKIVFEKINSMEEAKSVISSLFFDQAIIDEKKTVAVVNGAFVSGLGADFEELLIRMGVNVVSVTTADSPIQKTRLVYSSDNKSYTVSKIEKVLGVSAVNISEKNISDIILYLGKDAQNLLGK